MELLVWIGAALTVLGLAGILGCVVAVLRARRAGLDDAALKAKLQSVVAWNMGAFALSALGLMMVVLGVLLA